MKSNSIFNILYGSSVLLSAFLLFWIQPLLAKQLTPIFGGSPMVWNITLFFFQSTLLLGYAYSYYVTTKFSIKNTATIHLFVMLLSLLALPIGISIVGEMSVDSNPYLWLLQKSFLSVGVPFFILATTAPLLQFWYAHTKAKKSPYFLYSVSNVGSFSALFLFLILLEPFWGTIVQLQIWSVAFILSILLVSGCGFLITFNKVTTIKDKISTSTITWNKKITWLLLAFAPASLLHGVTFFITNDLFSLPLLWLIPLALYLLTFVFTFTNRGELYHSKIIRLTIYAVFFPLILVFWIDPAYSFSLVVFHIIMFVFLSLACHGELYKKRPDKENLTSFYLWISIGGALAGLFNAIIAPIIFNTIFEYPISIALAIFLVMHKSKSNKKILYKIFDIISPIILVVIIIYLYEYNYKDYFFEAKPFAFHRKFDLNFILILISIGTTIFVYFSRKNNIRLSILVLALFFGAASTSMNLLYGLGNFQEIEGKKLLFIERNFYGIIRVTSQILKNGEIHSYYNGTIPQTKQNMDLPVLQSTYIPNRWQTSIMDHSDSMNLPIAVLGMGVARYGCFGTNINQKIIYYEINHDVVSMAHNPNLFTYTRDCPRKYDVVIGDARIMLEKEPNNKFGAILSTVHWSNTVPFHLYTKEAINIYLDKLAPGGYLSIFIPQHHFDFHELFQAYSDYFKVKIYKNKQSSLYTVFIIEKPSDETNNKNIIFDNNWRLLKPQSNVPIWTDDFHNILSVL
jgi:hypothetical protein